jgi:CHAD domain-containing protein
MVMSLDGTEIAKPVKKLMRLLGKVEREPTAKRVHDLRVTSRRVESTFQALSLHKLGVSRRAVKSLRRLHKRAGKVRDMDVLTGFASTFHLAGEEACSVELLEYLGAKRRKFAKSLDNELHAVRRQLHRELQAMEDALKSISARNGAAVTTSPEVMHATATALGLTAELAAPARLGRDNLHAYRLQVKELRNVLEMAKGSSHSAFVDELGHVKDAIGEWHDWQELMIIADKILHHGNRCGLLSELRRITTDKYKLALTQVQRLRDKYLREPQPKRKGGTAQNSRPPQLPVWQGIAMLA